MLCHKVGCAIHESYTKTLSYLGFCLEKYSQLWGLDNQKTSIFDPVRILYSTVPGLSGGLAPYPSDHYLIHPFLSQTPDLANYRVNF